MDNVDRRKAGRRGKKKGVEREMGESLSKSVPATDRRGCKDGIIKVTPM